MAYTVSYNQSRVREFKILCSTGCHPEAETKGPIYFFLQAVLCPRASSVNLGRAFQVKITCSVLLCSMALHFKQWQNCSNGTEYFSKGAGTWRCTANNQLYILTEGTVMLNFTVQCCEWEAFQ